MQCIVLLHWVLKLCRKGATIAFSGCATHAAAVSGVAMLCREEEKRQKVAEREQNREAKGDFESAVCNLDAASAVRQSCWAESCAVYKSVTCVRDRRSRFTVTECLSRILGSGAGHTLVRSAEDPLNGRT